MAEPPGLGNAKGAAAGKATILTALDTESDAQSAAGSDFIKPAIDTP